MCFCLLTIAAIRPTTPVTTPRIATTNSVLMRHLERDSRGAFFLGGIVDPCHDLLLIRCGLSGLQRAGITTNLILALHLAKYKSVAGWPDSPSRALPAARLGESGYG